MSLHKQWLAPVAVLASLGFVPQAAGQQPTVLTAGGGVYSLAFSPDGLYLAAGTSGEDCYVIVWDLTTGRDLQLLKPHERTVRLLVWAPNYTLLAIYTELTGNCVITPWNVLAGKAGKSLEMAKVGGMLAMSDNCKVVVTCNRPESPKVAYVWDLEKGKKLATLEPCAADKYVSHAAFSADGKTLVTGGQKGTIKVWEVPGFKEKASFELDDGELRHLCISPTGKTVVTRGQRKTQVWDLTAKQLAPVELKPKGIPFAFSPDGKLATIAEVGQTDPSESPPNFKEAKQQDRVDLWDVEAGKIVACMVTNPRQGGTMMRFSPDGQKLAINRGNGTILLLNVADFKKLKPPAK